MPKIGRLRPSEQQGEPLKAPRALRIIVADDDHDAVLTLMMVLRNEGHEVRGVYRGADVVRHVEEFDPHAVLVDIHMPDFNGYDVARALRENGERATKPLLVGLSGVYKQGADRVLAEIVGFDYYLTKPYAISDVLLLLAPLRSQKPGSQ